MVGDTVLQKECALNERYLGLIFPRRLAKSCPDPMSGRFRYDPEDEIKSQTESDAIQLCKLYFRELRTGGWAGGSGEKEKKRGKTKREKRDKSQTTQTGEESGAGKVSHCYHGSSNVQLVQSLCRH